MFETYKLPQGKITIIHCDKNLSIGFLELDPGQELPKHDRPVTEELLQVDGQCTVQLFDKEKLIKQVELIQNRGLIISANQFHIHKNPTDKKSITAWRFRGNITEVIDAIRSSFKKP